MVRNKGIRTIQLACLFVIHRDCLGVLGCEWCQAKRADMFDKEGREVLKPLPHPFCSEQSKCFGGVVGAITPYGDTPPSE